MSRTGVEAGGSGVGSSRDIRQKEVERLIRDERWCSNRFAVSVEGWHFRRYFFRLA